PRNPPLRVREGIALAAAGAHAMIDLTDGIATDCAHLARESGVAMRVTLEDLPVHPGVRAVAGELGEPPWRLAAGAGEDYELCFCVAAEDRERAESAVADVGSTGVTWIGEVTAGDGTLALLDDRGQNV